jgi:two-component system cell cycle sensor histidine kinase/response regulator CckA
MEQLDKIRILIVDDSAEQRQELISALHDPRLEIVEADSGEAGLELLKTEDFAVVLIDVRMPGMNGFELVERIRRLDPCRIIPVIFTTSTQPPTAHVRKGYTLGAVDFLLLPVAPEVFRAKVEVFVEIFHKQVVQDRLAAELEAKVVERTTELRYQHDIIKSLTDNAASGLFMLDGEGRITFMNPAAEQTLGRTFAEVSGQHLHEVVHLGAPDSKPCATPDCVLENAIKAGLPVRHIPEIFFHKYGRPVFVSCSLAPMVSDGVNVGMVIDFQDITEHKMAEDQLRHSEDRYRRLFETAQDGIIILDAEAGRIMDVNPFLARHLGYSQQELLGKQLWEIGLFRDIAANQAVFVELSKNGYVRYDNLPLQTKDGRSREVEFVSNIYVVGGETVVQCNVRDVTARKKMEEDLRNSESDLRQAQKVDALGKLSGGIAHDFNNLLTAINGYAELCIPLAENEEPFRAYLDEILKAGKRAADLTHQLLAFSRKQVLESKVMDLTSIVSDVVSMLRRIINANIRLTPVLEAELWNVRADPVQIHQVVLNLAVNARDALPNGGEITITTANVDSFEDPGADGFGGSRRYVMLTVKDTGMGMDGAILGRIFDPFFTTKDFGKGTGMGLATVDGIVRQSGGHIKVESAPGQGSCFKIFLPRVDAIPDSTDSRMLRLALAPMGIETILMAEDDEIVRTFTRRALEMHGYKILEAEHAERAMEISGTYPGPIHLLLTDMLMPGMNGRELADKFRIQRPGVPVLYMSGYTNDVIKDQGMLEPGAVFLQKPFSPMVLIDVIQEALAMNPQIEA